MRPNWLLNQMQQRNKKKKKEGPPIEELKGGLNDLLKKTLEPDERVIVCTEGGMGEAMAATDSRVMLLKCGILSSGRKEGTVQAYDYDEIYMFEWGRRRRILRVIPFKDVNKKPAGVTFLAFHDKTFANAVDHMAEQLVKIRKKKPELADKANEHARQEAIKMGKSMR